MPEQWLESGAYPKNPLGKVVGMVFTHSKAPGKPEHMPAEVARKWFYIPYVGWIQGRKSPALFLALLYMCFQWAGQNERLAVALEG